MLSPEKTVAWNIPLFSNMDTVATKWDWVKEWNKIFGGINPRRKGSDKDCITRMKAFFADNPDVRKDDVIGATQMYIRSLSNPEYITSSHYFISKGIGRDRVSALSAWVDKYQTVMQDVVLPKDAFQPEDLSSKMQ